LSLTGDVPITKVKIGANQEYQYITNFKVLQKAFKDHGIDKVSCLSYSIPSLRMLNSSSPFDVHHHSPFLWIDSSSKHPPANLGKACLMGALCCRCKMQDNLEFLQWLKKFWDQNWDGTEYDAAGRA